MIACVDVCYRGDSAKAACVTFRQWEDAAPTSERVLVIDQVEPYAPGQFYRRELPCVLAILNEVNGGLQSVVIDGYVWLDASGRKGMGGYLYDAFGQSVPVVGVAKTRFATAAHAAEVFRGSSRRPLFVTSAGVDQATAAECIRRMHGRDRIPTLLKWVDRLSRSAPAAMR